MVALCRWMVVLTLLLATGARVSAASTAEHDLETAVKAFEDHFYDRAEAELSAFSQKYPTSPRIAEVILLQAQARVKLTNYAGAIQLLSAHQASAGTNADQYLFWLAEANLGKGDWRTASDGFAKLAKEFPGSSRCLEAALGEATARAALAQTEPAEWRWVIDLLKQTNGVFQSAVGTNGSSDQAVQGCLLLSEAQLATKDYRAAEETLQPLAKHLLKPQFAWQWQYLLCRIHLAQGQLDAALQGTTNLLAQAGNAGQRGLQAESVAFQAGLYERLGLTKEATAAYQQNLAAGVSPERQRQALLKIAELSLAQNKIPEAAQTLETFLNQNTNAASADLALLTLGELRLRQYAPGVEAGAAAPALTNTPAATNGLQLAEAPLSTLVKDWPKSPLVGKAQLDLGWCYWREGRLPEAQAAFQAAVERLPVSSDQATAYFRLADTQFQQTNYAGAIVNYSTVIDKFAALPEVKSNLVERALSQKVQAALAAGNLDLATNALRQAREWYPERLGTALAVLMTGQALRSRGDAAGERKMLEDFARTVPRSPLLPELELAIAASYEQEKKWPEAIAQYDRWLASFTNSPVLPRAEYNRAWATSQAERLTNALGLFTDFVAKFPTNELAPSAQIWVADYYFNLGQYPEAELNYKTLFQNPRWAGSKLAYEAQLMAGRAAMRGQRWKDAKDYLTSLYNNTNGPSMDLRLEGLLYYGRTLMQWVDPDETNKLAKCEEATRVFGLICDQFPTDALAAPAWIERGKCYMQWALARQQYDSLSNALSAYQRVDGLAQADVAARSEATLGQAIVLEKWAEQKADLERVALLKLAVSNCLNVAYGNILRTNETRLDPFWTKAATIKAFNLLETLQAWAQVVSLYDRLTNSVWPNMPEDLVQRALKAREKLKQEEAGR
jgi:TolA-binding protein